MSVKRILVDQLLSSYGWEGSIQHLGSAGGMRDDSVIMRTTRAGHCSIDGVVLDEPRVMELGFESLPANITEEPCVLVVRMARAARNHYQLDGTGSAPAVTLILEQDDTPALYEVVYPGGAWGDHRLLLEPGCLNETPLKLVLAVAPCDRNVVLSEVLLEVGSTHGVPTALLPLDREEPVAAPAAVVPEVAADLDPGAESAVAVPTEADAAEVGPEPELPPEKPKAKRKMRARHPAGSEQGGEFVGDDPTTPEINEAWTEAEK